MEDKRIVSDMRVTPKDSLNREIHIKLEILTDWKVSDSIEWDLVLDTAVADTMETIRVKLEAIRYYVKDSDIFVDFEKPSSFVYYNQNKELITQWISHTAFINFPKRLKRYQKVLGEYHEK